MAFLLYNLAILRGEGHSAVCPILVVRWKLSGQGKSVLLERVAPMAMWALILWSIGLAIVLRGKKNLEPTVCCAFLRNERVVLSVTRRVDEYRGHSCPSLGTVGRDEVGRGTLIACSISAWKKEMHCECSADIVRAPEHQRGR